MTWLLLIYSVPAQPSRKRATIWREIKRAGAVYLRDGVCALPERERNLALFMQLASQITEFGGKASVARSVEFDEEKSESIIGSARNARAAEYADLKHELLGFQAHLAHELGHRQLTFSDLEELEADLAKLRLWSAQIETRDFTGEPAAIETSALLDKCEQEIAAFLEEAYKQDTTFA